MSISPEKYSQQFTTAEVAFLAHLADLAYQEGDILYYTSGNLARLAIGSTNNVLTVIAGEPSWQVPASGGVTAVSIVSTNGFAGTSSGGTTPALTISTTITGILKGNGTAISAASSATDYQVPITFTTTGTSGVATFSAGALNIPNYTYTLPTASTSVLGGVKVDGTTITISGGVITAVAGGSGTVTTVSVVTNQGVSGSVATATTTPAITLTLGALTGVTSFNGLVITANTGAITTGTWTGTAIALANGGTGQTALVTTPTASTIVGQDANKNYSANNLIDGFTTTATAAGTTTLVVGSTGIQIFTGTLAQTVKLPTTGVVAGQEYIIINQSTGLVTVQSSGANTITILAAATSGNFTAVVATPTTAANWAGQYFGFNVASGKVGTLNNNITFSGTDTTTMTFPTTTATIARTDAGQTFTGTNVFGVITATTLNGNTFTTGTYTLTGTAGKTLNFTNSITLTGTDAQTYTFPSTSKTMAANDGSNWTFGSQAIGDIVAATSTTAFGRIAAVAIGSVLTAAGVTTAPVWSSAPQITTIELGNASDTTLSRSSGGVIAVEGVVIPSISSTNTLTNKRITRRTASTAGPGATPATNSDNVDVQIFTALAADITSMTSSLTGTPTNGDLLEFRFTDNGTARAITWGTSYESTTILLPTTTVISTLLRVGFEWNSTASKWDCIAVA